MPYQILFSKIELLWGIDIVIYIWNNRQHLAQSLLGIHNYWLINSFNGRWVYQIFSASPDISTISHSSLCPQEVELCRLSPRPLCSLASPWVWPMERAAGHWRVGGGRDLGYFPGPISSAQGLAVAAALLNKKSQLLSGSHNHSYSSLGVPLAIPSPGPSDLVVITQSSLAQRWSTVFFLVSLNLSHNFLMSTFVKFCLITLYVHAICFLPGTWLINENKAQKQ